MKCEAKDLLIERHKNVYKENKEQKIYQIRRKTHLQPAFAPSASKVKPEKKCQVKSHQTEQYIKNANGEKQNKITITKNIIFPACLPAWLSPPPLK